MYIDLTHKTFTQELIVNVSDEVKQTQQHFFCLKTMNKKYVVFNFLRYRSM